MGIDLSGTRRAIFLDRDGVINRAHVRDGLPYPPAGVEELELVDGAGEDLRRLKSAGFLLLVVTNQPDIGRGISNRHSVDAIHAALARNLPIDAFFVCPHDDADRCACRKPLPGLVLEGARQFEVDLQQSFLIGDRWRDVEAGRAAGCRTVWIDYGYRERGPAHAPSKTVSSLREAVDWILRQEEEAAEQITKP